MLTDHGICVRHLVNRGVFGRQLKGILAVEGQHLGEGNLVIGREDLHLSAEGRTSAAEALKYVASGPRPLWPSAKPKFVQ